MALWLAAAGPGARALCAQDDPLAIHSAMRLWAAEAVRVRGKPARHLGQLHEALLARGWEERPDLGLTASEAFRRREGDCVSFALMLGSIARSRGLPVVFVRENAGPVAPGGGYLVRQLHLGVTLEGGDETATFFDARPGAQAWTPQMRRVGDHTVLAIYHSNLGVAHLLAGSSAAAVEELSRATALDSRLFDAWSNLGVARARVGDWQGAEIAYWRAIELAPTSATGWRNLALLLDRQRGTRSFVERRARSQRP